MKKSTVIRSDNPHTVKMQAGSNVAQSKSTAKDNPHNAQTAPKIDNIQHLPPEQPQVKTTPASPAPGKVKRSKARINTPVEDDTPIPPGSKAVSKASDKTPDASVWEEDNPIRQRLANLRTRNAELEEQIQRLNLTMPARGNRP